MSFFRRDKSRTHISVFGTSDVGKARQHNEDSFLVADLSAPQASLKPEVREHDVGRKGSLLIVADGMGGAAAGEVASAMATETVYEHMVNTWAQDDTRTADQFAARLGEAVEHANGKIHRRAGEQPQLRGMGTTVTVAGILGDQVFLTQVGDSRAYLVRSGQAIQLTKDQSLMQRLIDAGELTEEEAERSERKNIILQALGPEDRVRVDLTYQTLRRGDTLVLCSDGLSGQVTKDEIADVVTRDRELELVCTNLIDLANERGGPDNITVIAARFEGDRLKKPGRDERVGRQTYPGTRSGGSGHEIVRGPPPVPQGFPLIAATAGAALLVLIALAISSGFF